MLHESLLQKEQYTNDLGVTRVKNFDFDNYTSKNMFSYLYYIYCLLTFNKNYFIWEYQYSL